MLSVGQSVGPHFATAIAMTDVKMDDNPKTKPRSLSLFELFSAMCLAASAVLLFHLNDVRTKLDLYRDEHLNITPQLDQDGLIFNRVPKVGTRCYINANVPSLHVTALHVPDSHEGV